MESIYNYSEAMLKDYLQLHGEKPFRASQIMEWVYRHKVKAFEEMTNIKKSFVEQLAKDFSFDSLALVEKQESTDGTVKFLFRLADGNLIETVLMKQEYGYSVCVTTQVGCNMGCQFCASGMKKKLRNLETSELVLQLMMVEEIMNLKVTHVVVMGLVSPLITMRMSFASLR